MYKMRGVFTEYERMKIKERFRLGKVRKANEGHIIATEAPYGYTFIVKKGKKGDADFHQGYYQVNEYEAQIVKNLFSWVADEGLTLRAIVRRLQELKIPPRKSKRGVWNTSTLSTLYKNKTYIGEAHYGASYAVMPTNPTKKEGYKKIKKTSRKAKPENEWIKIPVPVIIDKEVFDRVNVQLRKNFQLCQRSKKNDYLLAGKIQCVCGNRRAGEGPQRGKFLYYRCADRVLSFPLPPTCKERAVNARIADVIIWDKIVELMSSPELMREQIERWMKKQNDKPTVSFTDITTLEKEMIKLKSQEDRYNKAYGAELFTMEQLREYTIPIRERMVALESQIAQKRQENAIESPFALPTAEDMKAFAEESKKALGNLNFEAKRGIVVNVIEKVVGTKERLQVYGYLPVNINECTIHRHCRVAQRREIDSL
jgi:site-specific DNA recombinase